VKDLILHSLEGYGDLDILPYNTKLNNFIKKQAVVYVNDWFDEIHPFHNLCTIGITFNGDTPFKKEPHISNVNLEREIIVRILYALSHCSEPNWILFYTKVIQEIMDSYDALDFDDFIQALTTVLRDFNERKDIKILVMVDELKDLKTDERSASVISMLRNAMNKDFFIILSSLTSDPFYLVKSQSGIESIPIHLSSLCPTNRRVTDELLTYIKDNIDDTLTLENIKDALYCILLAGGHGRLLVETMDRLVSAGITCSTPQDILKDSKTSGVQYENIKKFVFSALKSEYVPKQELQIIQLYLLNQFYKTKLRLVKLQETTIIPIFSPLFLRDFALEGIKTNPPLREKLILNSLAEMISILYPDNGANLEGFYASFLYKRKLLLFPGRELSGSYEVPLRELFNISARNELMNVKVKVCFSMRFPSTQQFKEFKTDFKEILPTSIKSLPAKCEPIWKPSSIRNPGYDLLHIFPIVELPPSLADVVSKSNPKYVIVTKQFKSYFIDDHLPKVLNWNFEDVYSSPISEGEITTSYENSVKAILPLSESLKNLGVEVFHLHVVYSWRLLKKDPKMKMHPNVAFINRSEMREIFGPTYTLILDEMTGIQEMFNTRRELLSYLQKFTK
jgi:hypothetical protein